MLLQRVVEDLKRKGNDMDRISDLSLDLQNLFNVRMKFRQKKKDIMLLSNSNNCSNFLHNLWFTYLNWKRKKKKLHKSLLIINFLISYIFSLSLQDYDTNVDKYNSTLEENGLSIPTKPKTFTLSDAVRKEVTKPSTKNHWWKHQFGCYTCLRFCLLSFPGKGLSEQLC